MKHTFVSILLLIGVISTLSAVPRNMVLVEVATGTWCQYCPGAAMGCHDLLSNGHPVAILKNHSSDTYTNAYGSARNSLYGITSFPTTVFDGGNPFVGGSSSSSLYNSYLPRVNARLAIESHFTISATGSANGNLYSAAVTVAKPEADSNSDIKLHAVLTESSIPQVWFNQTTVENVNRLMIPDQNGTAISLAEGQQTTINQNFTVQPGWVADNCELVLFLQNMSTKEVLQATKYSLNQLTGGYPLSIQSHDFSYQVTGTTVSSPVTISNYASSAVSGTINSNNPAFSSSLTAFNIPGNQTVTFDVVFTPSTAMEYTGSLSIVSDLWNHPVIDIPLSGLGYQLADDYAFQYLQGTYTPITGGMALGTETTRNMAFVDPAVPTGGSTLTGPGLPIGFNFNYLGVDFDRVGIHSNGWIALGQSVLTPSVNLASTNNGTPLSSTSAISPKHLVSRIAVLARYLQAQSGAGIRIETVGTEPNRELVIQWTHYRRVNLTGDSFNFQVRLKENGNIVAFVYGPFSYGTGSALTPDVGLRGLPDTIANNWKNVSSTTSWIDPPAGTSNVSRMTLSATVLPPSGTTYYWIPPSAMAPQPVIPLAPAPGATGMPITGFDLSWSPAFSGGIPEYYSVYMADDEADIYNQEYWETSSTTFNPVTEGGFAYNYGERWYWTVEAHNVVGTSIMDSPRWFEIEADPFGMLDTPVVSIDSSGIIQWEAVNGAVRYVVYSAEEPNGSYVPLISTTGLSWQIPDFIAEKAFYYVKAFSTY